MQLPVEDGGQACAGSDVEVGKGFVAPGLAVDRLGERSEVDIVLDLQLRTEFSFEHVDQFGAMPARQLIRVVHHAAFRGEDARGTDDRIGPPGIQPQLRLRLGDLRGNQLHQRGRTPGHVAHVVAVELVARDVHHRHANPDAADVDGDDRRGCRIHLVELGGPSRVAGVVAQRDDEPRIHEFVERRDYGGLRESGSACQLGTGRRALAQ